MGSIFALKRWLDWDFRFWSKVAPAGPAPDACWVWIAAVDRYGYGAYKSAGRKEKAHRYACIEAHGAPRGRNTHVLHSCHNRLCCRPTHLRWGTNAQNVRDRQARRARDRGVLGTLVA